MSANNFINHKNGIYVLNLTEYNNLRDYDEFKDYSDEEIFEELSLINQFEIEEFDYSFKRALEEAGFEITDEGLGVGYIHCNAYLIGQYRLEEGYYDGVQAIFDDDDMEEYNVPQDYDEDDEQDIEDYNTILNDYRTISSWAKEKIIEILKSNTTEILKVGQFSNGEAVYKIA
jgi:hypothetical protein